MIYDYLSLSNMYSNYSNINQKISYEVKNKKLERIKRGLYTDNYKVDAPVISNICCNPSYISFEYALSFYGLIPEYVSLYTCACYKKKEKNKYFTKNLAFSYDNIPISVFHYGITFRKNENGLTYKIATKEKALCDTLFSKYPVRSIKDLKILIFDDLRIDESEFFNLDFDFMLKIIPFYHSNTLNTLSKYIKETLKNEIDY